MAVETPENPVGAIAERARAIITRPGEEWPVIAGETIPSGDIFTRYAMPLAAIGPVAGLIGSQIMGHGLFGFVGRPGLLSAATYAVSSFVLSLVMLLVMAFVANQLAPRFGGEESTRRAFKLVAYAMTAAWLAGIFQLVPALGALGIVGLYSVYLFHVGAGPMMKIPEDQRLNYTAVNIICGIVLALIVGSIAGNAARLFGATSHHGITISAERDDDDDDDDDDQVRINIPGHGSVNSAQAANAAAALAAAAASAVDGNDSAAAAPAALQALLPGTIGSYRRTELSSERAGPGSEAEGTYEAGDRSFTLKVSDIAIVGALSGFGAALGLESNRENGTGYERTSTQDGGLVVEKWNKASNEGRYLVVVDKRFLIEAEGEAASIDELKAAVASIDRSKLSGLADNR